MSRQVRRAAHRLQRPLALEPLEDRLLLSTLVGPLLVNPVGANPLTPAVVAQTDSSAATPDTDTPPGGYDSGQTDTTPAAATSGTAQTSAQYPVNGSQNNRGTVYSDNSYNRYTAETYPTSGDTAEGYPPSRATAPTVAAPASTAVLSMAAQMASVTMPPLLVLRSQESFPAAPPSLPALALGRTAILSGMAAPGQPAAPMQPAAPEGAWDALRLGLEAALANPSGDNIPALVSREREAGPVGPQFLPLAGGLLPLDVAAWQRGVRVFFERLEALGDEMGAELGLGRLVPWCAALGAVTVALEVARRRLGKRHLPDLAETAGRGLAWQWLPVPHGGNPPESP